jgi:hypothetical protein
MIIRRATKVVAGTTMPRSATPWLPIAWPEGAREAGIGQRRGCRTAPEYTWGAHSRYGVASSSGRHCFALRGLARFYRNPNGTRLCGQSALSGSWRRSAPERSPRGPAKRGSGSGGDASTASQYCWDVGIPLRGRIFLWKTLLRPSRSHHSRRRLSRIPSSKANVAPAETCSEVP